MTPSGPSSNASSSQYDVMKRDAFVWPAAKFCTKKTICVLPMCVVRVPSCGLG